MGCRHTYEVQFGCGQKLTYWEGIPSRTDIGHTKVIELLGDTIDDGKVC